MIRVVTKKSEGREVMLCQWLLHIAVVVVTL